MLKSLGEWLRVAGHDVLILPDGTADRELVERAVGERRRLLTRDRKIAEIMAPEGTVVVLEAVELDDCVAELNRKLDIDWLYKPFTRCKRCNELLVEADGEQEKDLPEGSRETATRLLYCPSCKQLFWDGSHVARMRERLAAWNDSASPNPNLQ